MLFGREPAFWISVIGAAIALAVGFGLRWSGVQVNLVMTFVAALIPILAGVATRSQVSPKQDVQIALNAPPETTTPQLQKIIEQTTPAQLERIIEKQS